VSSTDCAPLGRAGRPDHISCEESFETSLCHIDSTLFFSDTSGYKAGYCPNSEIIHNQDYSKVDKKDSYHGRYRLRIEQMGKDTEYFLNKWGIKYMIEKLPGGDYSKKWDGKELVPVDLNLDSDEFKDDIVTLE
jgi:hypothetical protein